MSSNSIDVLLEGIREFRHEQFAIVQRLRDIALASGDGIREQMKYGGILFSKGIDFCGIFSYQHHVNLEFSQGAAMLAPYGVLTGVGRLRRHIEFAQMSDIATKWAEHYIAVAYQLANR